VETPFSLGGFLDSIDRPCLKGKLPMLGHVAVSAQGHKVVQRVVRLLPLGKFLVDPRIPPRQARSTNRCRHGGQSPAFVCAPQVSRGFTSKLTGRAAGELIDEAQPAEVFPRPVCLLFNHGF
jgi:hypothetical protein